ncbi:hypothetical protein M7I_7362 [Glarea lozoyensis 74030]|uniref:Uncharacterized protein n=1 Tax=Glarea lozoyensis (strain ATCC 74030 / MF5533) TaxID=1104152 RepID=H0EX37_GLAL7|nr:hypothetical protein M7I_7362 [Glarea lozoyensis 74030]
MLLLCPCTSSVFQIRIDPHQWNPLQWEYTVEAMTDPDHFEDEEETVNKRTKDIIQFIKQGDPEEKEEQVDPEDISDEPALVSDEQLAETNLDENAHLYLITIEKQRPAKELKNLDRVKQIIVATLGAQKEYKKKADDTEPAGAVADNAGPLKNAHMKLHSYLPAYDKESKEWEGTNVAVEYDAPTGMIRGLIGGPHPEVLFEYSVEDSWDEATMGPSYALSLTKESEASCAAGEGGDDEDGAELSKAEGKKPSKKDHSNEKRDNTFLSLWARAGLSRRAEPKEKDATDPTDTKGKKGKKGTGDTTDATGTKDTDETKPKKKKKKGNCGGGKTKADKKPKAKGDETTETEPKPKEGEVPKDKTGETPKDKTGETPKDKTGETPKDKTGTTPEDKTVKKDKKKKKGKNSK